MIDIHNKEDLRIDLMVIQKAQQIRIVKRLQDTLINTIYRLYVDPILHKHVVCQSNPNYKSITTYQAIRSRFEGVEKGQLCSLVIQEYRKEMIKNNILQRYVNTLISILEEERQERPTELKEKTRKKGKIQASWEAQTWKKIISLLMLANYENPALVTFRQMWDHVYPNNPLPVNKPGRKSKMNPNQEGSDEEECLEGDEEDQQQEINQLNSNILLNDKQSASQIKINKSNQNNVDDQSQQNLKSQEKYLNENQENERTIACEEQQIVMSNPTQTIKVQQKDIQQQNQIQFNEQNSEICLICCGEAQKIQQNLQLQQQEIEESDDVCLECLQNNFSQSINNNQFLINKNLDQIGDYPNQSDQQGYSTYDQFKENSKTQLSILNNQIIDNNPTKLIAQLQTKQIKELQNEKNETKIQGKDQFNTQHAEQNYSRTMDSSIQNSNNVFGDAKNYSLVQKNRIVQKEQEDYQQLCNVNHQNLQEKNSNKFLQLDKTESSKINNYSFELPQQGSTDWNIKQQRFEILQNIKKDKSMRTYSSQDIIDVKQENIYNPNQESLSTPNELTYKHLNQMQQISAEKKLSEEQLLQTLGKIQMNQLNSTFLNTENQIQQLQQHLNNISQQANEKLSYNYLQINHKQGQGEELIKDTNSTQGCSCCENINPASPTTKMDSINNKIQNSKKKNLLLHQNPEKNNQNQQYELKLEDNLKFSKQNNLNNQSEKSQFIQQQSKCPHNSQKMNGFQIAKSQQTINQYFSDKIQQLEQIIQKQSQDLSKSLEIQEQLRAENVMFRRHFESQIINQNQLLGLLKNPQSVQTELRQQTQQQIPINEQLQQQQQQQIHQQQQNMQQNQIYQQKNQIQNIPQYQQDKIHLISQPLQNINFGQLFQGDEPQNYFQQLKQMSIKQF
ncbi:hypothetical protein ABPG74_003435 [Tetrahymena malaccensis]